MQNFLICPE